MCNILSKILFIIFNFIFLLIGVLLIGVGVALFSQKEKQKGELGLLLNHPIVTNVGTTLIIIGCIIFVVTFFGCYGAVRNSKWILLTYVTFLAVVVIFKLALGIGFAICKDNFDRGLKEQLQFTYDKANEYTQDLLDQLKRDKMQNRNEKLRPEDFEGKAKDPNFITVMGIQRFFECCGLMDNEPETTAIYLTCGKNKNDGCYKKVKGSIDDQIPKICIIITGSIALDLIGIALAVWIIINIIKREEDEQSESDSES